MKIENLIEREDGSVVGTIELSAGEAETIMTEGLTAILRKGTQFENMVETSQKEIKRLRDEMVLIMPKEVAEQFEEDGIQPTGED